MRVAHFLCPAVLGYLGVIVRAISDQQQHPLLTFAEGRNLSVALFQDLEELARLVDISYCVGITSPGISKPFQCLSRCSEFPGFELVRTWNTGPLLSDSCGYVALDHEHERLIVAFRGTYSIANTIVDLSTVPQEYAPYPGSGGDDENQDSRAHKLATTLDDSKGPRCMNCTVHAGFQSSWRNTREAILPALEEQIHLYPRYKVHLVGHSLGGAVAALAGLDFQARGWNPTVTTFGEPRIGNKNLAKYLDQRFGLDDRSDSQAGDDVLRYRRVTHVDDPIPLLPLSEWGFAMHAGEIHISKPSLSPEISDLHHCKGDGDQSCIAGQDSTVTGSPEDGVAPRKRDLLSSVEHEVHDVIHEPWGIPSRYKLWQLFFAHRDYFWRLGLCVPGGDPLGGGDRSYQWQTMAN